MLNLWPNDPQLYYMKAVSKVTVAQVAAALRDGADVNAKGKNGDSVLMTASEAGNISCVKFLISKGADVNAKDKSGKSVLDWARGQSEIIAILKAAGAE